MTGTKTVHLEMDFLQQNQSQKHVTVNDALNKLDALVQLAVLNRTTNSPPGSPAEGDRYLIGPAPTGAWLGSAGKIAVFQDNAWNILTPRNGWTCYVLDEGLALRYHTTWSAYGNDEIAHVKPGSGRFVSTDVGLGDSTTTVVGVANRIHIFPYIPKSDLNIDQLSINCTTAVTSALSKIVVYASNIQGRPTNLLFESGNLDLGTTGVKNAAASLTFFKGVIYWLGVRHSSTATISAWQPYTVPGLDAGAVATTVLKCLQRTVTFADPAPDPWAYSAAEGATTNAPAIWLRTA